MRRPGGRQDTCPEGIGHSEGRVSAPVAPSRFPSMLPTDHLLAFLVTVYVLILIPGPSVLFVVSRGVALGRRSALATAVGNEIGLTLQLALVAVGVGSILTRSDAVYTTVKLIGAAYLVVLGVRAIRQRKSLAAALNSTAVAPRSLARTLREGFLVGATNPKGVLIFTAVLPQFIDRSRGHTTLQLISLGLICVLVALLSDGAWALAAGTARRWLGSSPRRLERLSVGGGLTLIALGVGLAVTGRKD
jgi:threonine/homoserine/homoserine lactone efflux protein